MEIEPKAFDLLVYLLHRRQQVVSKDELLDKVWPGTVVSEAALTRCIARAREAIGDDGEQQRIIKTQHGRGYRFVATVIEQTLERKLAAILHADVKGYSRLMGEDEVATLGTLTPYLEMMRALVRHHGGRVAGSAGDSLLAEFPSVVAAVQCAVTMQHDLKGRNAALPVARRVEFRMGINLGEVVVEGEQIHGDGINVAVRLEGIAEAGGICISEGVYKQIKNKLALEYEDLGEHALKNIAEPVRVWRVVLEVPSPLAGEGQGEGASGRARAEPTPYPNLPLQGGKEPKPGRVGLAHRKWAVVAVAGLLLVAGTLVALRYLSSSKLSTQHSALSTEEAQPPSLPLPDKPSIVVLPFVNMSKDPEQEYFSDGLTEVLTSDLSRLSDLFVIARNSAFTYKGKAVKVQDVSKEMGVRYVLEGSVQKAGEQVRIVAQLIDATTGFHLWSEQYNRPLQDLFALQDEIVQKIVTTLRLQLTLREQGHLVRKRTDNLEAYDAFLRGLAYLVRDTKKEVTVQARQMYEKATALDPQYAEAYVSLGTTYWIEWVQRWSVDPLTLERAFELGQQAVALDDSLPGAHSLLSKVYALKQQSDQAMAEGERAIALDPNNASSYAQQAQMLNWTGRPEEALRAIKQAMRLNPHYPLWYLVDLGWAYNSTGRYAEAVAPLKEAISRDPTRLLAHFNLTVSYVSQWAFQLSQDPQMLEQALATAQRVIALNDSFPAGHALLGYIYLLQQQYERAVAEMERVIDLDPNWATGYALLAETLSRVGRSEEAVGMVEQALRRKPLTPDEHLSGIGTAYYLAGRTEEAIAPLKQYVSRYLNILGAHLKLAAVYSELGRKAEARAEAAEVLRLNPRFSLEVHKQREAIKDPVGLERYIAALRKAGLR